MLVRLTLVLLTAFLLIGGLVLLGFGSAFEYLAGWAFIIFVVGWQVIFPFLLMAILGWLLFRSWGRASK
ncbi:hypothetical protein [Solirubrum puertoriconensis]|uniref:Uncharacterized protein n=1 Tax=Solirubrum puertoriconensis TaxID=1751427 RepID=A0A9X0L3V2_SOLP1|nr:hypothetical protein [Solirubrum puertoriconensis]KUG06892.1 hypothetical protein ASU33_06085 [Solirubrum puertoriconensis]